MADAALPTLFLPTPRDVLADALPPETAPRIPDCGDVVLYFETLRTLGNPDDPLRRYPAIVIEAGADGTASLAVLAPHEAGSTVYLPRVPFAPVPAHRCWTFRPSETR